MKMIPPTRTTPRSRDSRLSMIQQEDTMAPVIPLLKKTAFTKASLLSALIGTAVFSGAATAQQTTSYTYHANGQIETMDGPRTDVADITTYTYENGNRSTITNAAGHVIQLRDYNDRGQPGLIIDANNVETRLTYHVRGWLETITLVDPAGLQDQVTRYTYDNIGQIDTVTLPNGMTLDYDYDGSRRLREISNSLGERITYDVDNAGNRTQETITDNGGNIRYTLSRHHDELSRVMDIIGAESQTTHIDYDVNNNPETVTDPRTSVTRQVYDPLDRLKEIHDPEGGATVFEYDDHDRLKRVTDANNNATVYDYDAFGNLRSLDSPDTGITTFEYDEANNRTRMVDSRGVVTNYTYDALNRLRTVEYPEAPEENITYTYDQTDNNNFGIGRLTQIVDQSGTTDYRYDYRGNLIRVNVTLDTQLYSTEYTYGPGNNLTQITYPSGLQVFYNYDSLGRVDGIQSQLPGQAIQTVIENVTYLPFGPIDQYTYGNGVTYTLDYNQDYRLNNLIATGDNPLLDLGYDYDPNGNIREVVDNIQISGNDYGYDLLNRLTDASGEYGVLDYLYDPVGNRLERNNATSGTQEAYHYILGSNQLADIDHSSQGNTENQVYTLDDNGNTLQSTRGSDAITYHYNHANRLSRVTRGSLTAHYTYNALGQRVKKVIDDGENITTLYYHYNPSGQQIGISQGDTPLSDTLFLGQLPVAILQEPLAGNTPSPQPQRIEAEIAAVSGNHSVSSTNAGYSGDGYMDYSGEGYIEWTVEIAATGNYELQFGYALSSGTRSLVLVVDGNDITTLPFGRTGSWSTWIEERYSLNLTEGAHTIRLRTIGSSGPNVDYVDIVPQSVTPAPNTAPVATIASPASGTSIEAGTAITFFGTASDSEDGDLSTDLQWSSSLDGALGSGSLVSTTLSDGIHTITASVQDSGGLSASNTITVNVTAAPPAIDPQRLEGEAASVSGNHSVSSTYSGYSGSGYMDYSGEGYIEWSVEITATGDYELQFGYALNSGTRSLVLVVDGSDIATLPFGRTGSWSTWIEERYSLNLTEGTHTIRLRTIGSSGPNVDYVDINYLGAE